jgi:hypothetical protein
MEFRLIHAQSLPFRGEPWRQTLFVYSFATVERCRLCSLFRFPIGIGMQLCEGDVSGSIPGDLLLGDFARGFLQRNFQAGRCTI